MKKKLTSVLLFLAMSVGVVSAHPINQGENSLIL